MTPDLSTCRKVAGIKQTMRALREHRAEKLYIACDADPVRIHEDCTTAVGVMKHSQIGSDSRNDRAQV